MKIYRKENFILIRYYMGQGHVYEVSYAARRVNISLSNISLPSYSRVCTVFYVHHLHGDITR